MASHAAESRTAHVHSFENGFTLVAEPMPWLESAAFTLLIPAGCAGDPIDQVGLANFTSEMVQRGCGARSSREFINDLENLGVDHSVGVSTAHTSFGGAAQAENLLDILSIFADVVRRPHLPEDQLEDARLVCLQEVYALEDELARRALIRLRARHYGEPFGRSSYGTVEALPRMTLDDVRGCVASRYQPRGAILGVAGHIDWPQLRDHVGQLFADWQPRQQPPLVETAPDYGYEHIACDSSQTHIGVAYPAVPAAHPDFYQARGAVGVLSDGSSSRLFTRVREERGLCYAVDASYDTLRDRASVQCYAGTTTDRAQETLDVMLAEVQQLHTGIEPDELQRLKARFKSGLIMQQESSMSRSSSMAGQWYYRGRLQTLDEVQQIIDKLSCESINEYLTMHPPQHFTMVTLGAQKLEIPVAIS